MIYLITCHNNLPVYKEFAEKYDFSGDICTDVIRNQLLIETNDNTLFSTSTPKMDESNLKAHHKISQEY